MLTATASTSREDERLILLTPGERFLKALALSAYVRGLTWQGARLNAESHGDSAVVTRFLRQLYGDDIAQDVNARIAARDRSR